MSIPARSSIRQVAEQAGVSRMTVSNVMRGRAGKVSPETQARVMEVARAMHYTPVAQPSMQSRHIETRTIGLVFDHIKQDDYWGSGIYRGLRDAALELDYDLLTILRAKPKWAPGQDELQFLDRRSDGIIFVVPQDRYGVLETLVEHGVPTVACCPSEFPAGVASVELDSADAMQQAVAYLHGKGHTRIAHLAWQAHRCPFRELMKEFKATARRLKVSHSPVIKCYRDNDWDQKLIHAVEREGITAVTCTNDLMAIEAWNLAQKRGWKIPQQLSIIGLDDMPEAAGLGLTTLRSSFEDMGKLALQSMVALINGEETPSRKNVSVQLIERTSVARI